ncbi:Os10g0213100, partial [Oryza sativa Japonica Group]
IPSPKSIETSRHRPLRRENITVCRGCRSPPPPPLERGWGAASAAAAGPGRRRGATRRRPAAWQRRWSWRLSGGGPPSCRARASGTHPFLSRAHRARKRRAVEAPASLPAKSRRAAPPPSRLATSRNAPWSEFIGSEVMVRADENGEDMCWLRLLLSLLNL